MKANSNVIVAISFPADWVPQFFERLFYLSEPKHLSKEGSLTFIHKVYELCKNYPG
jgi:hypothetical protein